MDEAKVTEIRTVLDKLEADVEEVRMAMQVAPLEAQAMCRRIVQELR
jgi:hypothetical protein